jgi:hypothetical protein
MKDEKFKEILFDMYQQAFERSEPKGDFKKMMEEAELDKLGRKIIPFMDYVCDDYIMDEIIEQTLNKYKVKKEYYRNSLRVNFLLGCSPKSKRNN